MGRLSEELTAGRAQIFIYGSGGTRKTWWACLPAEDNYNILLVNGDATPTILNNLSQRARERIYMLDVHDRAEQAVFARFMAAFCNMDAPGRCYFNEETGRASRHPFGGATKVDVTNWSRESVIVIDHYSLLTSSAAFEYAQENSIDITDAEKDEWPGYGWMGRFLSTILEQLRKLPCHLIVIGHETMYEKYEGAGRKRKLVFQRQQPRSSSNPHGMTIADKFQEVYLFYKEGQRNLIDTEGNRFKDAQSKIFSPKRYEWEKLPAAAVLSAVGAKAPDSSAPAIEFEVIAQRQLVGKSPGGKNVIPNSTKNISESAAKTEGTPTAASAASQTPPAQPIASPNNPATAKIANLFSQKEST